MVPGDVGQFDVLCDGVVIASKTGREWPDPKKVCDAISLRMS